MNGLRPGSKAERLAKILADGPAIMDEIYVALADELKAKSWTKNQIRAHIDGLFRRKKITRELYSRRGNQPRYLWKLVA